MNRKTTTQRGLGWEHQRLRARLINQWIGRPCPICGTPMQADNMDFDHETPRALGGTQATRFLCRPCNQRRGGQLGRRLKGRYTRTRTTSRDW